MLSLIRTSPDRDIFQPSRREIVSIYLREMALGLFWATVSLVVFITITTLDMMGFFKSKNHFDVDGRVGILSLGDGMVLTLGADCNHHRWIPRNGKRTGEAAGTERCKYCHCGKRSAEVGRCVEVYFRTLRIFALPPRTTAEFVITGGGQKPREAAIPFNQCRCDQS